MAARGRDGVDEAVAVFDELYGFRCTDIWPADLFPTKNFFLALFSHKDFSRQNREIK